MREFLNHPNRVEKETLPQEKNALVPLNLDTTSQVLPTNEIWKELETVLARLRFFENHCVWWNTDGHAGADEQDFLKLTMNHMEKIVRMGRKVTSLPHGRTSGRHEVKNGKS